MNYWTNAYNRAMDRNEANRRRALLFRMMRSGASPDAAAAWTQLMGAQGVQGFGVMNPALYAQMVAQQRAPEVYGTMVGERLGMEGFRTNRYGNWLNAQSAKDLAAMNARRDVMLGGLQNVGTFAASRPGVTPIESPYAAATNMGGLSYQSGATMAGIRDNRQAEAQRRMIAEQLRRMAMNPEESEAIRQQAIQGMMYQYGYMPRQ